MIAITVMLLLVVATAVVAITRDAKTEYRNLPAPPVAPICDGSTCWDAKGAQNQIVLLEVSNSRLTRELNEARGKLAKTPRCGINEVAWWDATGKQRECVPSPLPYPYPS